MVSCFLVWCKTASNGHTVTTGGAVLAETLFTKDATPDSVTIPNSLDVYISLDHLGFPADMQYDKKVIYFMRIIQKKLSETGVTVRHFDDLEFEIHKFNSVCNEDFVPDYRNNFERVKVVATVDFQLQSKRTGAVNPLLIKLRYISGIDHDTGLLPPEPNAPTFHCANCWKNHILMGTEINILRCSYDAEERVVSFPINPMTAWYVDSRAFFYLNVRPNDHTMERIEKYQAKGFHFLGYYDPFKTLIQSMANNVVIEDEDTEMFLLVPYISKD
jgi:hypothetical protein